MPGDKSITHRALIFSALTVGKSRITGALGALDCLSTISCLRRLGLMIEPAQGGDGWRKISTCGRLDLVVKSRGPAHLDFRESTRNGPLLLDAGNSGTTMRIMSGLLAGLPGNFALAGDESLSKRDMRRVLDPLSAMGATVTYRRSEGRAPFIIGGGNLQGGRFDLPMASAQVEAALLVAGLFARGKTTVTTPARVRDHTLKAFMHLGIPFINEGLTTEVEPLTGEIAAKDFTVPGDISSAAFFLVAAAIMPGSDLVIPAVGANSGRGLVVAVLRRMGVEITYANERLVNFEPVCDIHVKAPDSLTATDVSPEEVPLGIDELPILALAFALAKGRSKVSGAAELKEKESNRLSAICKNLANQGVKVEEMADGFAVEGSAAALLPGGGVWATEGDHRLAMTGLVAQLVAQKPLELGDVSCIDISYPGFQADLAGLVAGE
ncbi:MAG: 3-phosphoshikimate 1-carboxyvinyltransferase [Cyanobacteria bacterium SZAS LIN-2]|nr:3-phosphoshikimate 1-carboxyvinyltransferase [Cyanobacteria bacterium SZAS LIN-3]MBS1997526.1 3-phosphoshikimate 1-carboxyvinyltransferase [Cyanobacteria bacterium SZAS LIN-2]